jgi:hypothetical protein
LSQAGTSVCNRTFFFQAVHRSSTMKIMLLCLIIGTLAALATTRQLPTAHPK